MSILDKPAGSRLTRNRLEPDVPPVLRRGREHRIVRWIGAANRRAPKPADDAAPAAAEAPGTGIIPLRWAETFGRPSRPDPVVFARSSAQVLPFRSRPGGEARPMVPRGSAAVQPPVPVLR